jgi:tripartite-type tricarboxylate transporter receptor subunit TctC
MALTPLLTPGVVRYDPRKFKFIGSPNREAHVLIASATSPVKTIDDVFSKEMIVAATAPGGAPFDFPLLTNELLGTKFRIVAGYKSSNEAKLATERGEVHGQAGHGWTAVKSEYADDLAKKRIKVVAAFGMQKHPDLKDFPLMPTGKTDEERQLFNLMYSRQVIGRPLMTPPDVPSDRLKLLRDAYAATVKDENFLAEAERFKVDIDPVYFDELERLLGALYDTPPQIVKRMQDILEASANK